jgi:8-oxo-dGTP diphosphatase
MTADVPVTPGPRVGSGVILFDAVGRILLQQRDDNRPPAGYGRWAIPGGGVEPGESPRDAALREFEEETAIRLVRLRFFATYTGEDIPGLAADIQHLFLADDPIDEATIEVHEGLAFRFWAPGELQTLPMNPPVREMLSRALASDKYAGAVESNVPQRTGAVVIQMDRWGRILLNLRDADLPPDRYPATWAIPGGGAKPGESPDAAALREFEEETGQLLEDLRLFRVYRRDPDLLTALVQVQHVYYIDADLELDQLQVLEGEALAYYRPEELAGLAVPPHHRTILEDFLASAHYRGLFH